MTGRRVARWDSCAQGSAAPPPPQLLQVSEMTGAQWLLSVVLTFARAGFCTGEAVLGPQHLLPSPRPRNRVLTQKPPVQSHPQGREAFSVSSFPFRNVYVK